MRTRVKIVLMLQKWSTGKCQGNGWRVYSVPCSSLHKCGRMFFLDGEFMVFWVENSNSVIPIQFDQKVKVPAYCCCKSTFKMLFGLFFKLFLVFVLNRWSGLVRPQANRLMEIAVVQQCMFCNAMACSKHEPDVACWQRKLTHTNPQWGFRWGMPFELL